LPESVRGVRYTAVFQTMLDDGVRTTEATTRTGREDNGKRL
jgi:hypothetical protein